jgi:hypothetical protein
VYLIRFRHPVSLRLFSNIHGDIMGNIIFGIIFIIGGLSGNLALRGTNSGPALAAVGAGLLIWGIVQVSKGRAQQD